MEKILDSEAFHSLEGKSKIQDLLTEGSQISIQKAMNDMLEQKIVEYSTMKTDENVLRVGDSISIAFNNELEG